MDQRVVKRINELYKKSKTSCLTEEELLEQKKLRQEYVKAFKSNLKSTLDTLVIVDEDGTKRKLGKH